METFIEQYFLKKGEEIEQPIKQIDEHLFEIKIVQRSSRKYLTTALLKMTDSPVSHTPPDEHLISYRFKPYAKRQLREQYSTILSWIRNGWIVEVIQLDTDGISAKETHYRMGLAYVHYLEKLKKEQENVEQQQWNTAKEQLLSLTDEPLPETILTTIKQFQYVSTARDFMKESFFFPTHWSFQKRIRFLQWFTGFFTLSFTKGVFDFKEIGATLFDEIGGSKVFDREAKEFIDVLERELLIDSSSFGLISFGKIVPIYFCGHVEGHYARYYPGVIHAITDDALLKDSYTTTNSCLWLVENRAVLTRMSMEPQFLEETNSLIVCLDGQIRSAHKQFLKQLVQCPSIEKVIIWTDYDEAGLIIAKHAAKLVQPLPINFIGRNNETFQELQQYEQWLQQFLSSHKHEQEQQLGGVEQWSKWI